MTLSPQAVEELRQIISAEYGLDLDHEASKRVGTSLVNLYSALLQNKPSEVNK